MSLVQQDFDFMQQGADQAAELLRSVGNKNRLLILCLLSMHQELCVGEMLAQLHLSQSALSQHLARMRQQGVVACRRESQTVYYHIADPNVLQLIASLKQIFCP